MNASSTDISAKLQQLCKACKSGDVETVRKILDTDPGVINDCDEFSATPLYHACLCGHKEILRVLLKNGACYIPGTPNSDRCLRAAQDIDVRNVLIQYDRSPFSLTNSCDKNKTPYQEFLGWFYNSLPNPDVILCLRKSKTLLDDPTNNIPNTGKQESISQIEETGREVVAHRAVLMARSEYLRNILQDNKWSQEERINIEEEEVALMHLFVEYLYTGHFKGNFAEIESLKKTARCLQLKELSNKLEQLSTKKLKGKKNQKINVTGASHLKNLQSDLEHFFSSGFPHIYCEESGLKYLSDRDLVTFFGTNLVIVSVQEEIFKCYKPFLLGQSEYFRHLFTDSVKDSSQPVTLIINDVDSKVFSLVLRYLYSEAIPMESSLEVILDLLKASVLFALSGLTQRCSQIITTSVSTSNIFLILPISRELGLHILSSFCYTFIAKNITKALENEDLTTFLTKETASSERNALGCEAEGIGLEVVDHLAVYLLQMYEENSACIQEFALKLKNLNISCNRLNTTKCNLLSAITEANNVHNKKETIVNETEMFTTNKEKRPFSPKFHNPKQNKIHPVEWCHVVHINDSRAKNSCIISLPSSDAYTLRYSNISRRKKDNSVHFRPVHNHYISDLPTKHSQCCTIL